MFTRILVPTDGSPISAGAEQAAIAFARWCDAEVIAVAVGQPPFVGAEAALATDAALDGAALLAVARRHALRVETAARAAGVRCTTLAVLDESPAHAIVEQASQSGCDLIFMGTHGRRGWSRLLAGSVTRKVLAGAPVPVIVYPPPREAAGTGPAPVS